MNIAKIHGGAQAKKPDQEMCACISKVLQLRSASLFAWRVVDKARRVPRGTLARSDQSVKRVKPDPLALLDPLDLLALRARKARLGRPVLLRHPVVAARCALRVPTATRRHAERSAIKTKCLSSHTVARVEVRLRLSAKERSLARGA
jgi:hypothetical protein